MHKAAVENAISLIGDRDHRPLMGSASNSRVVIYCQDGLGLGHLRRNIEIGKAFLKQTPEGEGQILLIADSPVAPFFQLPEGMDHIKLPSIRKVSAGQWQCARLRMSSNYSFLTTRNGSGLAAC